MLTPEELIELDKRIGANADKLIHKTQKKLIPMRTTGGAGRPPSSFENCVLPEMQEVLYAGEENWPLWVDDILSGVSRLDWYRPNERSIPLSARNLLKCFALLDTISSYAISHLLHIGERQAQRYYKACCFTHNKLIDGYCDERVRCTHYPEVFVYPRESIPQTDQEEG